MTYMLAQIAALMLGMYLLGAIFGCLSRRLFNYTFGHAGAVAAGVSAPGTQPVIEVSNATAASTHDQSRFERALAHGPESKVAPSQDSAATASSSSPTADIGTRASNVTERVKLDTPEFSPVESVEEPVKPAPESKPIPTPITTQVTTSSDGNDEGEKYIPVSVVSAAAAAAIAARASQGAAQDPEPSTPEPEESTLSVATATIDDPDQNAGSDDLTRIRGIHERTAQRLNREGVRRYEQIARWQADDVTNVDAVFASPGRVSRENWIEQAQVLAKGGTTTFARERDAGNSVGENISAAETPAAETSASEISIASSTAADLPSAANDPDQASANAATAVASATATAVAAAAAAAAAYSTPPSYRADKPAVEEAVADLEEVGSDPLHQIVGIDEHTAGSLNGQGITQFQQIANWSEHDVSHYEELFSSPDRITHQRWVEQAQYLARGDDVPTSLLAPVASASTSNESADPQPATDLDVEQTSRPDDGVAPEHEKLSGMRSVRSAAFRGESGAGHNAQYDDLKRLRGIGVLIEKKLNSLGVTSFEQIANWTNDDIDRISGPLEFKGRVERENWVEQARILASGGQTEFSRRLDRNTS